MSLACCIDSAGTLVVEYMCDAWGKLLSTIETRADTLGERNPFCIYGCVYDEATGRYSFRQRKRALLKGRD